jgi:glycosyltransferase involved in cell wall biosynthesis
MTDGTEGYIVPFGNHLRLCKCLQLLVKNGKMRTRMGKAARKLAEKNTWERIALTYGQFFQKQIANAGHPFKK